MTSPATTLAAREPDVLAPLLQRLGRRDERALAELYDCTIDRVYGTALRVLRDPDDAEEVACDVYRVAWDTIDRYDADRGTVIAWLLNLAWSRAVDRLRRERAYRRVQQPLHPDVDPAAYADDDPDPVGRMIDAVHAQTAIGVALRQLTDAQRQMVALAFFEDLSHAEIAARTGVPLGTVKSHVRRGLATLRLALDSKEVAHGRA